MIDTRTLLALQDDSADDALPTGHVTHDERGNAIWEWLLEAPEAAAGVATLTLADAAAPVPTPGADAPATGAASPGRNPYDGGPDWSSARPAARDLRELSRWIELRRRRPADREP